MVLSVLTDHDDEEAAAEDDDDAIAEGSRVVSIHEARWQYSTACSSRGIDVGI